MLDEDEAQSDYDCLKPNYVTDDRCVEKTHKCESKSTHRYVDNAKLVFVCGIIFAKTSSISCPFVSLLSGLSPAMYKWWQVQCQGQVSVPSQLYWKVLPDACSEWTPAAPADLRQLQPNSGPLHTHTAADLQQRPESW